MTHINVFTTRKEIYELTGLTPDEHDQILWDVGFNLDDWDWGICLDEPIAREIEKTIHYNGGDYSYWVYPKQGQRQLIHTHVEPYDEIEKDYDQIQGCPYWMALLFNSWQGYCAGGSHTEYNGKHYYLWHHS